MPLYEYACNVCDTRFERIQKFSDPPITVCPNCGGDVRKLISSPAIQFKGAGWYVNDYAKAGSKSESKSSDSGSSDGKSSDTKAASADKGGEKSTGDSSKSDAATTKSDSTGSTAPAKSAAK